MNCKKCFIGQCTANPRINLSCEILATKILDHLSFVSACMRYLEIDQMGKAGLGMLYSKLISQAIITYLVGLEKLRFDTTSISRYGAYEQEEGDEIPLITYGHR